jgi:hypothetical protein
VCVSALSLVVVAGVWWFLRAGGSGHRGEGYISFVYIKRRREDDCHSPRFTPTLSQLMSLSSLCSLSSSATLASMTSEGQGEPLHRGGSHVPPDIAFPYLTTDISRGGVTTEYRAETAQGYVSLREAPSRLSTAQGRFALREDHADREGGLKEKKLVTWEKNDSENPWNWSKARRWCELEYPTDYNSNFYRTCTNSSCTERYKERRPIVNPSSRH